MRRTVAPRPVITLVVRRRVHAAVARVFAAWTRPEQLRRWWGPAGVKCVAAEVDLRVGGAYRIGNQFADGRVLWIVGQFERIERPHRLVYSWRLEGEETPQERVSVTFKSRGADTEVVVRHQRIVTPARRRQHQAGWRECLAGLAEYLGRTGRRSAGQ
jgi:uncharacterized protein YndB with AHSA1/START domain